MKNEKSPFFDDFHTDPKRLAKDKDFTTRAKLRLAALARLEPSLDSRFGGDSAALQLAAQRLAFIPTIRSGWGPMDADIQSVAGNLADGYLAHRDAFASEGFPEPEQAAIEALKGFDFSV